MTNKTIKAVFMGTPDFAVPCLKALTEIERVDVVGVVTQPDRPRGRGHKLTPSPVKSFATEHGIDVYQPERVKTDEFVTTLKKIAPDIIVVVAFGQILSKAILDVPRLGCVNVHASLLPSYRGAAPMQWCIINGETKTGVTTMMMDVGLDTGDMLERDEIEITPDMTLEELHDALSKMGARLLVSTVNALIDGTAKREKQDDTGVKENARYSPMLTSETGHIDWTKSAKSIHDLVRALDSWPGAYSSMDGKKYKIWRTKVSVVASDGASVAGEIVAVGKDGIDVATGDGVITITEIQAPGKKRMSAADYLRGHAITVGSKFE